MHWEPFSFWEAAPILSMKARSPMMRAHVIEQAGICHHIALNFPSGAKCHCAAHKKAKNFHMWNELNEFGAGIEYFPREN